MRRACATAPRRWTADPYVVDCRQLPTTSLERGAHSTALVRRAEVQTSKTFVPNGAILLFHARRRGCTPPQRASRARYARRSRRPARQSQSSRAAQRQCAVSDQTLARSCTCARRGGGGARANTLPREVHQLCVHGTWTTLRDARERLAASWTRSCTACAAPSAHADTLKLWLVLSIAAVVCAGEISVCVPLRSPGSPKLATYEP